MYSVSMYVRLKKLRKGVGEEREREKEYDCHRVDTYLSMLQYLINQSDALYPEHLFEDVQRAVFEVHHSRQIHNRICSDPGTA